MFEKYFVPACVLCTTLALSGCDMWDTQQLTLSRAVEGGAAPANVSALEMELIFLIAENVAKNYRMIRELGSECNRTPCARFNRELVYLDMIKTGDTVDIRISAFYAPRAEIDPHVLARDLKKNLEENLKGIVVTISK